MAVRVSLDGNILVNTPIGWEKATIKSKRDSTIKGLFVEYTTDLDFWGDGFTYIDTILTADYCQTIDVYIETNDCTGEWVEEFTGIIQLTQISSYDVDKRIIKTKILDESFNAKIDNNKSLKALVSVGKSKNGELFTSPTALNIKFFLPTADAGTYIATTRKCYRVYDCFKFIIDYMTDGTVDFYSDTFSTTYNDWVLCNGKEVRVGNGNGLDLEVSFKELFLELYKKCNLSFAIEPSSGLNQFQLRLEPTTYFEQDVAILTIGEVLGIMMSFNKEELYSNVQIGSKDYDNDVYLSYPPLNFKTTKEENYTIQGDCNVDKTLDLVSSYVIDTNVIEYVLLNPTDTKYDKKTFLIVTDGVNCNKYKDYGEPVLVGTDNGGVANRLTDTTKNFVALGILGGDLAVNATTGAQTNVVSVSTTYLVLTDNIFSITDEYRIRRKPFSYNKPLNNYEVVTRFLGGLPNSVIKHISLGATANFRSRVQFGTGYTSFPTTINKIPYNDDSTPPFFDDGNNFDTTTYEYKVPSSGIYGFEANLWAESYGTLGNDIILNGSPISTENSWTYGGGVYFSIYGGFGIGGYSYNIYTAFLRQYLTIYPYTMYQLKVYLRADYGGIVVGGQNITGTGWHTVDIWFDANPPQYLEFKFFGNVGYRGELTIQNVILKPYPRFEINQIIVRSSSAGVVLQQFPNIVRVNVGSSWVKSNYIRNTNTFSVFKDDIITVKLQITKQTGNGLSFLIKGEKTTTGGNKYYTEFKTIYIEDGGGDILPTDPTDYPIYEYKFEKAITYADFKALKDSPEKGVSFSKSSANFLTGWRNSIEYDRRTGVCKFNLRSKTKINGDC